jgi:hypothetical protein
MAFRHLESAKNVDVDLQCQGIVCEKGQHDVLIQPLRNRQAHRQNRATPQKKEAKHRPDDALEETRDRCIATTF